ncbi:AI-2E family transporter [Brackiella oedipodis]|uniref:AI-2E family transporter n=1 Tax=Brackiella oedipodis TaxID=124225 RepID=UPI0004911464|nr:AI-2E family transporter [Brackiella oedipodis]
MAASKINFNFFVLLLALVTIGFIVVIFPFYGAIFWAVIFAVIFSPINNYFLSKMPNRRNTSALITLTICILIGIIPLAITTVALVREIITFYSRIDSGQINFSHYMHEMTSHVPSWVNDGLSLFNINSMDELQAKLQSSISEASRFLANQAVQLGTNTFQFFVAFGIMIYLLFFFLRDGSKIMLAVKKAIPLKRDYRNHLFEKFTSVVKATVKGNVVIAVVHGILGGVIFAILGIEASLLWGVLMGFLSLLPAIGSAIVWLPVALYFLATDHIGSGIFLIAYGCIVIGLSDNVLRPILVGKSTRLPDYIVLVTTVGGLTVFGPNGFVIGPLMAALFITCWQLFSETVSESDLS